MNNWQSAIPKSLRRFVTRLLLRRNINARVYRGDGVFVGICDHIAVITEGATAEEAAENLGEAIGLYFDNEDRVLLGFSKNAMTVIMLGAIDPRIDKLCASQESIDVAKSLLRQGFLRTDQWGHSKFERFHEGRKQVVVMTEGFKPAADTARALASLTAKLYPGLRIDDER